MFHIITTSRTTRALHRFQSLAERLASILALGLLLAFSLAPELFLAGGAR